MRGRLALALQRHPLLGVDGRLPALAASATFGGWSLGRKLWHGGAAPLGLATRGEGGAPLELFGEFEQGRGGALVGRSEVGCAAGLRLMICDGLGLLGVSADDLGCVHGRQSVTHRVT